MSASIERCIAVAFAAASTGPDASAARLVSVETARFELAVLLVKAALAEQIADYWRENREPPSARSVREWVRGYDTVAGRVTAQFQSRGAFEFHQLATRACVGCACTMDHACPGGCVWVSEAENVCSACREKGIA